MGFIIVSEDVTTGTIYNGTWTLSRPISGVFTLMSQYIYPQDLYWMWTDNNGLKIRFTQGLNTYTCTVNLPTTYTNSNSFQDIAESWETEIQSVLDNLSSETEGAINVEVHLLHQDTYFELSFTGDQEFTTLLWEDAASTSKTVFDKQLNETSLDSAFDINYTTAMTTQPELIECEIAESQNETLTTHGSTTNLVFKTSGDFISGQIINIRVPTDTLTIKFYTNVDQNNPVPLAHNWHLYFQ